MNQLLLKFSRSSRISMCVHEVVRELERRDRHDRAMVALMLVLAKKSFEHDLKPSFERIFDQPSEYSKDVCIEVYQILEGLRNFTRGKVAQLEKFHINSNLPLASGIIKSIQSMDIALSLLMITAATGYKSSVFSETESCWKMIQDSFELLPQALKERRHDEIALGLDVFDEPSDEVWLSQAKWIPEAVRIQIIRWGA